jgi:hypothetical protein
MSDKTLGGASRSQTPGPHSDLTTPETQRPEVRRVAITLPACQCEVSAMSQFSSHPRPGAFRWLTQQVLYYLDRVSLVPRLSGPQRPLRLAFTTRSGLLHRCTQSQETPCMPVRVDETSETAQSIIYGVSSTPDGRRLSSALSWHRQFWLSDSTN